MGFRAALGVPLVRDGQTFGVISLHRLAVGSFNEKQIELIGTFADQAVIAIENTRLLTEQREALDRQTATAEVLQVINSSLGDLAPVFETILEKAHGLCAVAHGGLLLYDGEKFRAVAVQGLSEALAERLRQGYVPGPNHPSQRLLEGERFAQVPDWAKIDDPIAHAAISAGVRTTLFIPLRGRGKLLGQIAASRMEIGPFTEKEIAGRANGWRRPPRKAVRRPRAGSGSSADDRRRCQSCRKAIRLTVRADARFFWVTSGSARNTAPPPSLP